jgi:uncharacterized membrane protein
VAGEELKPAPRLDSIDVLRGIVMVVMALDHVRDFFHEAHFNPLDLSQTSSVLFLTRWFTHFCAPVFVFLAGTGAFLAGSRGKTRKQLSLFLLTRGLWLVLLELSIIRVGWWFGYEPHFLMAGVIWAIGWSMVVLAGLVFLPASLVLLFGVALIASHNAFDGVQGNGLWKVLHVQSVVEYAPGWSLFVMYPLVPWIGVLAAGYGFGAFAAGKRRRILGIGLGSCALFVLLRALNRYGDPALWSQQPGALFTLFSFVNCAKYPPSLDYLLMTLGPALVLLAVLPDKANWIAKPFVVYGRVPLFYYVLHIPLIHFLAVCAGSGMGSGHGFGLPVVYGVWLFVVALLYYPCLKWGELKRRNRSAWLSYL